MKVKQSDTTVFIVDDDQAVLDSLVILLTTAGLKVTPHDSGQAFLDAYDPAKKGCLVLDIRMPDMSGLELQEILVTKQAHIPIIIMTAHGDIKIAVKSMKLGAFDFIEKPFKDEVIINSIYKALESDKQQLNQKEIVTRIHEQIACLTEREREVFNYLTKGDSNKVIAAKLEISPRTVEIHRARVMEKLQAPNLSQIVKMAITAGIE